jgi:hypothetical protein
MNKQILTKLKEWIKGLDDKDLIAFGMWLDEDPDSVHELLLLLWQEHKVRNLPW